LFVGVCFSLWFFIAVMSQLAALAWMPPGGTGSLQPMLWTHAVVTVALAAIWGATRWVNLAPAPLRFLDAFATLAQGVAGGVILPFTIVAFRADLSMVMGLSFVCVARAAQQCRTPGAGRHCWAACVAFR
jgi:hypothetical protein